MSKNWTYVILLSAALFSGERLFAQVGIGTTTPNSSSALDIATTNKGLLIPRVALTWNGDQNTISKTGNYPEGLLVYNTGAAGLSTAGFYYWNGTQWTPLSGGGSGSVWTENGQHVYRPSGNVGVRVSTPSNMLDIANGTRTGTHQSNYPLYVTGNLQDFSNGAEFRTSNGQEGVGVGKKYIYAAGSNSNADIGLRSKGSGDIHLIAGGSRRLVAQDNGNVGIGTNNNTVQARLHVNGTVRLQNVGNTSGTPQFLIAADSDGDLSRFNYNSLPSSPWTLTSGNINRATGNVGIGMSTVPNARLHVNGSVRLQNIANTSGNPIYFLGADSLGNVSRFQFSNLPSSPWSVNGSNVYRSSGSIGLGVGSTPQNNMDISRSTRTGTHGVNLPLYITGFLGNTNGGAEFRTNDGTEGLGLGKAYLYNSGTNANQDIGLWTKGTGHIHFVTNNARRMTISGIGNVGIGLGSGLASTRLHVNGGVRFQNTPNGVASDRIVTIDGSGNIRSLNVSAFGLDAWTKSGSHAYYTNSGNVGIGINTPTNKLDIAESTRSGTHGSNRPLYVTGNLGESNAGAEFLETDGTEGLGIGHSYLYTAGSNANQNIGLWTKGTGNIFFRTNNAKRMTITGTGNVGIGTETPDEKLHVVGRAKISQFGNGDLNNDFMVTSDNTGNLRRIALSSTTLGLFQENGQIAYRPSGKLAIGTSNADHELEIVGDMHTQGKIVVHAGVFNSATQKRGIYFAAKTNSKYGIYLGQPGANKSMGGGTAVAGYNGVDDFSIRFRTEKDAVSSNDGFIFENSDDELLMSINGSTGETYVANNFVVNGTASKPGGGSWAATSDRRLKTNVSPFNTGIEFLKKVKLVNYEYNDQYIELTGNKVEGKQFQGVIAQELMEIAPDMVEEFTLGGKNYLKVDPSKFTWSLIKAAQEQQVQLDKLTEENKEIKAELAEIKKMLKELTQK